MNAATRMRASCSGWRRGGFGVGAAVAVVAVAVVAVAVVGVAVVGVALVVVALVAVAVVGRGRLEGTVTGMIPIRYVTDRFGYLHDRTSR